LFAHAEACGFGHRSRHRTPISGSIKVRVLTRARGRCECCGAHEHQRALEVDHILPRNHGGSDDLSNLQALCIADAHSGVRRQRKLNQRRHEN
jgi:5-methylcytosine-specific restriction endonuclease McrA